MFLLSVTETPDIFPTRTATQYRLIELKPLIIEIRFLSPIPRHLRHGFDYGTKSAYNATLQDIQEGDTIIPSPFERKRRCSNGCITFQYI